MQTFAKSSLCAFLPLALVTGVAWSEGRTSPDVSEIELRRLFEPTGAEIAAEASGTIYIYDGLRDVDIQRALNEEFDRVQNMMFIRTRKTDEHGAVKKDKATGTAVVEDDGC
jgi:hypothetical protein